MPTAQGCTWTELARGPARATIDTARRTTDGPSRRWQFDRGPGLDAAHVRAVCDTLATVATGRTALVTRLRILAAQVEALPLESVAEVLGVLEAAVAVCEQ